MFTRAREMDRIGMAHNYPRSRSMLGNVCLYGCNYLMYAMLDTRD